MPDSTCKQMALSFSHITFGLFLSMMLLMKLSLMLTSIIFVAMPIAMWFLFLLLSQRVSLLRIDWGPTKTWSQTFLDISMDFIKTAHCGQLEKPTNFSRLLFSVDSTGIIELVEVFIGSIMLAEFMEAYYY